MIEIRVQKNGEKSYRVKLRISGFPSVSRSFKRISDAKRWEAKKETEIREGKNFDTPQNKRMTIQELIDRYISDHLPLEDIKEKTKVERSQRLNWWIKEIGTRLLSDIKLPLLNKLKAKLIQTRSKAGKLYSADTVNYYLGDFSLVLGVASNEWELIRDNPMLKVKKMKKPRGRLRFLDSNELNCLLKACKESSNQHLYLIVLLCLSTGARKGEILALTRDLVDLDRQRVYLQETKNGERRMLSLKEPVLSLLKSHINSMLSNQKII
ncbi:tyrosine-type recombinase/integrase, partial [bacterium]|nr:tyrosine-type recombinase/integrase [bacterium]